jgi:stage V sporulation protein B
MGAAVWLVYHLLYGVVGNSLSTVAGVLAGVAVYAVLILALDGITEEELRLLPKGRKIAAVVSKFKRH